LEARIFSKIRDAKVERRKPQVEVKTVEKVLLGEKRTT